MDNFDSNPTAQDVHNLVRKLKPSERANEPASSSKRLKKWMSEFGEQSENSGRIFVEGVGAKVGCTR